MTDKQTPFSVSQNTVPSGGLAQYPILKRRESGGNSHSKLENGPHCGWEVPHNRNITVDTTVVSPSPRHSQEKQGPVTGGNSRGFPPLGLS
ncbi:hypothetical protein BaRGS_00004605 [Batillaria attramentaria]|uniref:Uncharacterized protein n=1 Tax=Batillaria attramentaria TaxID=370345 RepID=A0ABD0LYQ2_9CAEN